MRALINFFAFSLRRIIVSLVLFLVIPLSIPYVIYGITSLFADAAGSVTLEGFQVQSLPQAARFPDFDNNFRYLAVDKTSAASIELVEHLININKLNDIKIKKFDSEEQAYHYFNVKNIALHSADVDEEFASITFCEDFH